MPKVNKDRFLKAISIISSKWPAIRLRADEGEGTLTVEGVDSDTGALISMSILGAVDAETYDVTVGKDALLKAAKTFVSPHVYIGAEQEGVIVGEDKGHPEAKFPVAHYDFPQVVTTGDPLVTLSPEQFERICSLTALTDQRESRPVLQNVLLTAKDGILTAAAADGYIGGRYRTEVSGESAAFPAFSVKIHARALETAKKIAKTFPHKDKLEIRILLADNTEDPNDVERRHIVIAVSDGTPYSGAVVMPQEQQSYPDLDQVLDPTFSRTQKAVAEVLGATVLRGIDRTGDLRAGSAVWMRFTPNDVKMASKGEAGHAVFSLGAGAKMPDPATPHIIALSAYLLRRIVKDANMKEFPLTFLVGEANHPIGIRSPETGMEFVQMPMDAGAIPDGLFQVEQQPSLLETTPVPAAELAPVAV